MEQKTTWRRYARWVAVAMAVLGVVGLGLDFSTHHLGNGGAAYFGNYEGLETRLWASIGMSALLILLDLLLCLFVLLAGGGQRLLVRYASLCIVLLGVQMGINMMAMGGPLPELADHHTRRMYLGYLACMGMPLTLARSGRTYGQSLADRVK